MTTITPHSSRPTVWNRPSRSFAGKPIEGTIYYSYVTDGRRRLIGFVSLRNLILARPRRRVESVMKRDIIFARVDDDREKAAGLIAEYDLISASHRRP